MVDGADRTNHALAAHLAEAGLTPRALARELNRMFGPGTTAETAPYHWRDVGGVPRNPLPALTAHVLSRRIGKFVTVDDLWPGNAERNSGTLVLQADTGMQDRWTTAATLRIADDWLTGGIVDRRTFLAVSGTALARTVNVYLDDQLPARAGSPPACSTDDPLIEQIEASVPRLQLMDDEKGGAAGLGYVGTQVRAVMLVLRDGGHTDDTTRRLLVALADLCQLAGWKSHDAGKPGLAQRYFFTGLRAAHDVGYRPMAAHILADLAFQSASLGDLNDGIVLGEAAERVAAHSPVSVQASVSSRLAFAYAATGQTAKCEFNWQKARDLIGSRPSDRDPEWMYYLTPNHLDCQAGYALVLAGRTLLSQNDRGGGRAALRKGEALLRTGVYARPHDVPYQRRALYEGSWLALAYTSHGRLDDACEVARLALPRLAKVKSPRSAALLHTLAGELHRRQRNPAVADFLPSLRTALAHQPA